jgi:hypothetical protein
MPTRAELLAAVLSALFLAAVMTFGDFLWAALDLRHRVATGIAHGAAMCLCIGLVIGVRSGRPAAGALLGPLVGVLAAGVFYGLAPYLRWSAMLPAWMLFWILFSLMQQRLGGDDSLGAAFARGLIAAVASGLAFYAISGIWTNPSRGGPNYMLHFGAWTVAFVPGFVALFAAHRARRRAGF